MYVAVGLGVVTKGPVGALLPAAALVIYLTTFRRLNELRELMLPTGLAIVAAIVLPWYIAIYLQHGWGHILAFILQDNLSRYTQAVWGPRRGWFFYIPVLIGDFFPWSLFMIPLAWYGVRHLWLTFRGRSQSMDVDDYTLLAIWIGVIVVFFSLSRSKEDLYILPIYPAAAALVGGLLDGLITDQRIIPRLMERLTTVALAASLIASGAVTLFLFRKGTGLYEIEGANLIGYAVIIGGLITAIAAILSRMRSAILATALSIAVCNWVFVIWALPDFERFKPVRPLCEVIASEAGPDALVGYYRTAYPSMVFYLRRPIFEYYQQAEIEAAFASGKEVFCLMTEAEYEALGARVSAHTRVLASHPMFRVKLNGIFNRVELPRVVLISNKGGTDVTQ
jgi:4-amino-4-deoxy-L-arabinose transferase-like glycosyltransferase